MIFKNVKRGDFDLEKDPMGRYFDLKKCKKWEILRFNEMFQWEISYLKKRSRGEDS